MGYGGMQKSNIAKNIPIPDVPAASHNSSGPVATAAVGGTPRKQPAAFGGAFRGADMAFLPTRSWDPRTAQRELPVSPGTATHPQHPGLLHGTSPRLQRLFF